MNKIGKKIVVTGGAGFIGSHLVDQLIELGFVVEVVDNLSANSREQVNRLAKLHALDISDLEAIRPIFKDAEYVFHLAAIPSVQYSLEQPDIANQVNVSGTLNVLMAASSSGVKRLIYSSSCAVYGDQVVMPLHEKMSAFPKSPYGLQKYIGELYCRLWSEAYALSTISLRYFNVYGPRQKSEGPYASVVAKFVELSKSGEAMTITGDGEQTRDFVHVRDVVRANLLAMDNRNVGMGEAINIGSGQDLSVNDIAKLVGGKRVYSRSRLEPRRTLADNSLAEKLLGWQPEVKIEEGIADLKIS